MSAAPLLKDVDTSYHTIQFDGSFLHENAFRKPAGEEVDAAWSSLGVHCKGYHTILSFSMNV